ncbi:MAG: hypothetical protein NZM12_13110 [Steroidobacteraceae bacterium]|nr:hypothetical protein [Steroidobacteraceae bacterium]MDW8259700.1 hypothetical protein [Gammaproteobacteria bacterium]
MIDDPAVLSFLLALLAGLAGWLLGRQAGRRERPPWRADYARGLEHLLNRRLDAAAYELLRSASGDDDAVELQFALGGLFRKRGEFGRATQLHERLAEHADAAIAERARFELAQDYMAAGLLDRAEQTLLQLAAGGAHRDAALLQLAKIYETESDWDNALRVHLALPAELQAERAAVAAHYLCELAEHALLQGDLSRVATLLQEAERHCPSHARIALLRGQWAERQALAELARDSYRRACRLRPPLSGEISARLAALGDTADVAATERPRYQCSACGFPSLHWHWRCPRCFAWDQLDLVLAQR